MTICAPGFTQQKREPELSTYMAESSVGEGPSSAISPSTYSRSVTYGFQVSHIRILGQSHAWLTGVDLKYAQILKIRYRTQF